MLRYIFKNFTGIPAKTDTSFQRCHLRTFRSLSPIFKCAEIKLSTFDESSRRSHSFPRPDSCASACEREYIGLLSNIEQRINNTNQSSSHKRNYHKKSQIYRGRSKSSLISKSKTESETKLIQQVDHDTKQLIRGFKTRYDNDLQELESRGSGKKSKNPKQFNITDPLVSVEIDETVDLTARCSKSDHFGKEQSLVHCRGYSTSKRDYQTSNGSFRQKEFRKNFSMNLEKHQDQKETTPNPFPSDDYIKRNKYISRPKTKSLESLLEKHMPKDILGVNKPYTLGHTVSAHKLKKKIVREKNQIKKQAKQAVSSIDLPVPEKKNQPSQMNNIMAQYIKINKNYERGPSLLQKILQRMDSEKNLTKKVFEGRITKPKVPESANAKADIESELISKLNIPVEDSADPKKSKDACARVTEPRITVSGCEDLIQKVSKQSKKKFPKSVDWSYSFAQDETAKTGNQVKQPEIMKKFEPKTKNESLSISSNQKKLKAESKIKFKPRAFDLLDRTDSMDVARKITENNPMTVAPKAKSLKTSFDPKPVPMKTEDNNSVKSKFSFKSEDSLDLKSDVVKKPYVTLADKIKSTIKPEYKDKLTFNLRPAVYKQQVKPNFPRKNPLQGDLATLNSSIDESAAIVAEIVPMEGGGCLPPLAVIEVCDISDSPDLESLKKNLNLLSAPIETDENIKLLTAPEMPSESNDLNPSKAEAFDDVQKRFFSSPKAGSSKLLRGDNLMFSRRNFSTSSGSRWKKIDGPPKTTSDLQPTLKGNHKENNFGLDSLGLRKNRYTEAGPKTDIKKQNLMDNCVSTTTVLLKRLEKLEQEISEVRESNDIYKNIENKENKLKEFENYYLNRGCSRPVSSGSYKNCDKKSVISVGSILKSPTSKREETPTKTVRFANGPKESRSGHKLRPTLSSIIRSMMVPKINLIKEKKNANPVKKFLKSRKKEPVQQKPNDSKVLQIYMKPKSSSCTASTKASLSEPKTPVKKRRSSKSRSLFKETVSFSEKSKPHTCIALTNFAKTPPKASEKYRPSKSRNSTREKKIYEKSGLRKCKTLINIKPMIRTRETCGKSNKSSFKCLSEKCSPRSYADMAHIKSSNASPRSSPGLSTAMLMHPPVVLPKNISTVSPRNFLTSTSCSIQTRNPRKTNNGYKSSKTVQKPRRRRFKESFDLTQDKESKSNFSLSSARFAKPSKNREIQPQLNQSVSSFRFVSRQNGPILKKKNLRSAGAPLHVFRNVRHPELNEPSTLAKMPVIPTFQGSFKKEKEEELSELCQSLKLDILKNLETHSLESKSRKELEDKKPFKPRGYAAATTSLAPAPKKELGREDLTKVPIRKYHMLSSHQENQEGCLKNFCLKKSKATEEMKTVENLRGIQWRVNNFYKWQKLNDMSNVQITLKRFYSCTNLRSSSLLFSGESLSVQPKLENKACFMNFADKPKSENYKKIKSPKNQKSYWQPKYPFAFDSETVPAKEAIKLVKANAYLKSKSDSKEINTEAEKDSCKADAEQEELFPKYMESGKNERPKSTLKSSEEEPFEKEVFLPDGSDFEYGHPNQDGPSMEDKESRKSAEVANEPKQESIWKRLVNYFKARPYCPPPEEWRKMAAREKAQRYAKIAGLIVCEKDELLSSSRIDNNEDLPKVITYSPKKKKASFEEQKRDFHSKTQKRSFSTVNNDLSKYPRKLHGKRIKGTNIIKITSSVEDILLESILEKRFHPKILNNLQNRFLSTSMEHRLSAKNEENFELELPATDKNEENEDSNLEDDANCPKEERFRLDCSTYKPISTSKEDEKLDKQRFYRQSAEQISRFSTFINEENAHLYDLPTYIREDTFEEGVEMIDSKVKLSNLEEDNDQHLETNFLNESFEEDENDDDNEKENVRAAELEQLKENLACQKEIKQLDAVDKQSIYAKVLPINRITTPTKELNVQGAERLDSASTYSREDAFEDGVGVTQGFDPEMIAVSDAEGSGDQKQKTKLKVIHQEEPVRNVVEYIPSEGNLNIPLVTEAITLALKEINSSLENKDRQILAEKIIRSVLIASSTYHHDDSEGQFHDCDSDITVPVAESPLRGPRLMPRRMTLSEMLFSEPKDEFGRFCQAKCLTLIMEAFRKTENLSDINYEDMEKIKTNRLIDELNKLLILIEENQEQN